MAVEGVGNLVQNLANQFYGPTQDAQAAKPAGTVNGAGGVVTEDTYTPSAQNSSVLATAQDAGIFQVNQIARTPVTDNVVIGQASLFINQNGAPAQATNAGAPQTTAATGSSTPSATASANVQAQLQALNAALPALGLSYEQIQQIDRIASLVHDFNPAAYVNLVNQFEALAQQAAERNSAVAVPNASAGAPVNATTSANGDGFQVQGISIKFSGVQPAVNTGPVTSGTQGAAVNNNRINSASLQIDQVQFTLGNSNGQTIKVQAPLQNTAPGSANQPATQAKSIVA